MLLVGSIGHRTSCHRKQHSSSSTIAGALVILQTHFRLPLILRFNKHQLILQHFLQYFHFIPLQNHMLHVLVAGEVADHAIRYRRTQFYDEVAVVSDVALVVTF